jgi:hypothetical protein
MGSWPYNFFYNNSVLINDKAFRDTGCLIKTFYGSFSVGIGVCNGPAAYPMRMDDSVRNDARYKYRCDGMDDFSDQVFH